MAIMLSPAITLILRVDTPSEVSANGWRYLFERKNPYRNCDGEIMVFRAMNGTDIDHEIGLLSSMGFIEPNQGEQSDMVVWEFGPITEMPSWLSVVQVDFFQEGVKPCRAWKFTNSQVYSLIDFRNGLDLPTKGYQCDWPPLIGKIS